MNASPECSCPVDTCSDPPCPLHGFPKCPDCGEDYHDFISCEARRQIWERRSTPARQPGDAIVIVPAPGDRCDGGGKLRDETGLNVGACPGCRACS